LSKKGVYKVRKGAQRSCSGSQGGRHVTKSTFVVSPGGRECAYRSSVKRVRQYMGGTHESGTGNWDLYVRADLANGLLNGGDEGEQPKGKNLYRA